MITSIVTSAHDLHRAVRERRPAHSLVLVLTRGEAQVTRLASDEQVAEVGAFGDGVVAHLTRLRPERAVVAANRDRPLDAREVDPREHARRHPALAGSVAGAVLVVPPVRSQAERAFELVVLAVDTNRDAVALVERARNHVLEELARQRV